MLFILLSGCALAVAVPLLIAAFVLSIVSMSQRRVAGGVSLLLACIIIPPVAFLARMATVSPQVSFRSPTPLPSPPAVRPTASPSSSEPSPAPTAVSVDSLIDKAKDLMKAKGKVMWLVSSDELKKIRAELLNVPASSRRYAEIQQLMPQIEAYLDAAQKEEQSAAKRAASRWMYTEQPDEMGRGISKFATVESDNLLSFAFPYSGEQHASLRLQKSPKYGKGVMLAIERGQFSCSSFNGCKVSVRFDNGAIQNFSGAEAANFKPNVVFVEPYEKFVNQLKHSKKVVIEADFFQDGSRVMTFHVDGLDW